MSNEQDAPEWARSHGTWAMLGEPWTAHALGSLDAFAWTGIDLQHGRWDDASMIAALSIVPGAAVVRVRSLDAGLVGRALDAGAAAVIAPMVQSPDDARELVRASLYPPRGERSWGPIAGGYGTPEQASGMTFAMIETERALACVEQIASVPGLSGLFVGPFDLALALGTTVDDLLEDGIVLTRIAAACRTRGLIPGAFAGTRARTRRLADLGYEFLAAATESELLARGAETTHPS